MKMVKGIIIIDDVTVIANSSNKLHFHLYLTLAFAKFSQNTPLTIG